MSEPFILTQLEAMGCEFEVEMRQHIRIIGPTENSKTISEMLDALEFRFKRSGPYTDRKMFPKCDVTRFLYDVERAIEPPSAPPELVWTSEAPTKAGLYWVRNLTFGKSASVREVYQTKDGAWFAGASPVGDWGNPEWAGPIPEPKEPTGGPPC